MKRKLQKLCECICELDPPANLCSFILARIEKEKIGRAKRQLFFPYFGLVSSFFLAIGAGVVFGQSFLQSEFWMISSLLFSDIAVVLKNWDTFFLSLLETFPVAHATIFLIPIFLLLLSAERYFSHKPNGKYKFNLLTRQTS